MTLARGLALVVHEGSIHCRIFIHEIGNHAPTLCGIGGVGNIGPPGCKPFFFLYLDTFPPWIPQHYVETAGPASLLIVWCLPFSRHPENIREGQVPVEELVLLGKAFDLVVYPGSNSILFYSAEYLFSNRINNLTNLLSIVCLVPNKRSAPGISPQLAQQVVSRLQ